MAKESKKKEEPVMLVRPAIRSLGLDYLHVSLLILVVILIGLAVALSAFHAGASLLNCPYGITNSSTCITPHHTSMQALEAAESAIASYAPTNSSLSLLPYYSEPNLATVSYLSNQSEWLVVVPYLYPANTSQTLYFSMLFYDSNLTLVRPFLQIPASPYPSQNQVVALGAVSLYGKSQCTYNSTATMPIYAFIDPYAPGALAGMKDGINATDKFGSAINLTYKFIFTPYATQLYAGYGINATQQNAEDLFCASQQQRFPAYLANYTILFNGAPLGYTSLEQVAQGSGLNMTVVQFMPCNRSAGTAEPGAIR